MEFSRYQGLSRDKGDEPYVFVMFMATRDSRVRWIVRECIAGTIWTFIVLKLVVFDIDIYLLDRLAPQLRWILDFKVFVIIALIGVAWAALGQTGFQKTMLYVGTYPAIVLFWRLPKLAFRRWPLVILSAPIVYRLVSTLRTTFLLYTALALSTLCVM